MNISLIMLIPLLPMIISDYRDRTVHVLWHQDLWLGLRLLSLARALSN